jgi:glycosyltransferase involved in cell wall biosynthesis
VSPTREVNVWFGIKVVVVVPARNEARRIRRVVRTLPEEVDHILVVNDASTDATTLEATGDRRFELLTHDRQRGVGAAIATGYRRALELTTGPTDAFVVMAGDGQMDPKDLPGLLLPIARNEADYVKGDRFFSPEARAMIPWPRYVGGRVFSWVTSEATGIAVTDSQCGYTALSRAACEQLDLDAFWPTYGYPNDLLATLVERRLRIAQVPVSPVYEGAPSGLRPWHLASMAGLLGRIWWRRRRSVVGK